MLKKLRMRFIAVTMAVVLFIMGGIFAFLVSSTRRSLQAESLSMLQSVAADPLALNWPGISSSRLPYFTVRMDSTGVSRVVGNSYYDVSDPSLLSELVDTALKGENGGYIPAYNLRYYRTLSYGSGYIIFADVSSEIATMRSLGRSCLWIGLLAAGVFLLLSVLLSRWAVRPAETAFRQQKQFVSDASHELKTPLTVILTNAEMLRSGEYGEEDRARFIDSILTMSRKMRSLVEDLLALARADNAALPRDFSPLDWSALTEDALLPFEALFFEKGLTLSADIQPGIRVRGSEQPLRQAVEILLDNARKYAAPGTVRLELRREGRKNALLTVATPGEPLSGEECRAIFRRFYRADKAHSSDGSYGLGLSIAESIVTEHKGKIWAEGHAGENRFFIRLPVI